MPKSIKIDDEDYDRLFKMRARPNKSVRLVIKALLNDNDSMKSEIMNLQRERDENELSIKRK